MKSQNVNLEIYNNNRNRRANTRDALIQFINSLSISDMDSIRTQAGMLSLLTSQTDEISRKSEVKNVVFLFFIKFFN